MRVVDLSLKISQSLKVFPGSPQPCFVPWTSHSNHGYDSEALFMSTHTGTHMDAPSHFAPGTSSIDRIPAGRFVSQAAIIRTPKKANELIEATDLKNHDIRRNDAVVIATGWEKKIRAKNYMTENPGLSAEAARFLVRKNVSLIAIDCPSIDAGSDSTFSAHKILLSKNILVVENLCNLEKIKARQLMLIVAPLKLQNSTGSPVRALAVL